MEPGNSDYEIQGVHQWMLMERFPRLALLGGGGCGLRSAGTREVLLQCLHLEKGLLKPQDT